MSPRVSSDWFAAQANCSQYNAHLVTISSESENSFLILEILKNNYNQRQFWIGLKRSPFDYSAWAWVDASRVSFTDWFPGQPDDHQSTEGCAELASWSGKWKWNDFNCSNKARFVCEKVLIANLPSCSNDNGGCSHICLSTFSGASCKCKDGFISQNNGQVCLDPTTFMTQQAQPQAVHSFDVVLLIFQLLSFILLIPVSCVLVSFYIRVSRQRHLKAQRTVKIHSPSSNCEHGSSNDQISPLTNPTSSFENEDISDVQV